MIIFLAKKRVNEKPLKISFLPTDKTICAMGASLKYVRSDGGGWFGQNRTLYIKSTVSPIHTKSAQGVSSGLKSDKFERTYFMDSPHCFTSFVFTLIFYCVINKLIAKYGSHSRRSLYFRERFLGKGGKIYDSN